MIFEPLHEGRPILHHDHAIGADLLGERDLRGIDDVAAIALDIHYDRVEFGGLQEVFDTFHECVVTKGVMRDVDAFDVVAGVGIGGSGLRCGAGLRQPALADVPGRFVGEEAALRVAPHRVDERAEAEPRGKAHRDHDPDQDQHGRQQINAPSFHDHDPLEERMGDAHDEGLAR